MHAIAKDWQNCSQPSYNRSHHDEYHEKQKNVVGPKQKREPQRKVDGGGQRQLQHRMPREESGRGAGESPSNCEEDAEES